MSLTEYLFYLIVFSFSIVVIAATLNEIILGGADWGWQPFAIFGVLSFIFTGVILFREWKRNG